MGRHLTQNLADLTLDGPVGDRVFCLVGRSRSRVLRTVENPTLLRAPGVRRRALPRGDLRRGGAMVPRCAVVDLDPATAQDDAAVFSELAGYRLSQAGTSFGVDAVVTVPGRVRTGDPLALEEA